MSISATYISLVTRKSKSEREIWAADSETDPFKAGRIPHPFIWGARLVNGSEYREFASTPHHCSRDEDTHCEVCAATTREMLAFFRERDCIVYAHNGGKFDWHFILGDLEPWQPLMVINGRLAKFTIGNAEFRDSYNIMPMPLSAYKKDEIDYEIFEPESRYLPANYLRIREYLRSDCNYLAEMIGAFIAEFGLHLTQAGASMKALEKIMDIKAPRTSKSFYAELAPYYYGGRVECFAHGIVDRPFKIIDINSAYPYAMMHMHPYGDTIATGMQLPQHRGALERSFITLTCPARGAFPLRSANGSLIFPHDGAPRTFHITGWEFLAALETGALAHGEYQLHAVKQLPVTIEFSRYLDHFYSMKTDAKKNGDKARYEFSKRFLNSPYGKFGANPDNYEEFTVVEPRYIDAAEEDDGYSFAADLGPWALVSKPLQEEKQRYYNVAVSASVTGFVRAYDWRAIHAVKRGGGEVFYMDTDCLWATSTGDLELHPEKLGAWDVEAECDYGAIGGKKLYAARIAKTAKWKTASKGVKLNAAEIVRIAKGETVTFNPDAPTFSLKRGVVFTPRTIRRSAGT